MTAPAGPGRPPERPPKTAVGCMVLFGGVFVAAGLAVAILHSLLPAYRGYQASKWPTTQGLVTSSGYATTRGSKGHTARRIDIHYRYSVDGRPYANNQYDGTGKTRFSGYDFAAMKAAVQANRPGSRVTVYYDPADPAESMLYTGWPAGSFAAIAFAMLFVLIGGGVVFFVLYYGNARFEKPKALAPGRLTVDSRSVRRRKFLAVTGIAVFVNAVLAVMSMGSFSWCLAPFILAGMALIAAAAVIGLAMFNPTIVITFASTPLRVGRLNEAAYALRGNVVAVRSLRIHLEGREQITYTENGKHRTATHVAYHFDLLDTDRTADMQRGTLVMRLPADAMTSFVARHNRFTWHLCCRGEVAGRPDMKDDFDVVLAAAEGGR